ncbi:MAG: hypothetical protein ACW97P_13065 [Candidatus Hodarchaeales archaeon]|jgi:hypothetical protein
MSEPWHNLDKLKCLCGQEFYDAECFASHYRQCGKTQEQVDPVVRCKHCGDIAHWEGNAPLPKPLTITTKGIVEHHCGYIGAPAPRFTFNCPKCNRI